MAFFVGQKVVCITEWTNPWYEYYCPNKPIKGSIYHIRDIYQGTNEKGVRLVEILNPLANFWRDKIIAEPCFHETGFKPLVEKKTDISIFTKMLTPNLENA